jgi:septum site-determining protein MinC
MISIKGIRHGLLVTRHHGSLNEFLTELQRRLTANPAFFKGGRVSLDVGPLALSEDRVRQVRDLLIQHDVTLHGLVSRNPETEAAAQALGLVIDLKLDRQPAGAEAKAKAVDPSEPQFGEAVLWQRTLRSGQSIRHPGHVIVVGDVNPGSEIIAGGHVVVWGRLKGTVHAGANGDESALVCALDLSPMQLRIAGYITRSPEERRRESQPEVAAVRDGQIIAMPWK